MSGRQRSDDVHSCENSLLRIILEEAGEDTRYK